jgi:hypothetical protein
MGTAERYLREAEAAEATARSLIDPELRRAFEDLANQWREMARQLGESDPGPEQRKPASGDRK